MKNNSTISDKDSSRSIRSNNSSGRFIQSKTVILQDKFDNMLLWRTKYIGFVFLK